MHVHIVGGNNYLKYRIVGTSLCDVSKPTQDCIFPDITDSHQCRDGAVHRFKETQKCNSEGRRPGVVIKRTAAHSLLVVVADAKIRVPTGLSINTIYRNPILVVVAVGGGDTRSISHPGGIVSFVTAGACHPWLGDDITIQPRRG